MPAHRDDRARLEVAILASELGVPLGREADPADAESTTERAAPSAPEPSAPELSAPATPVPALPPAGLAPAGPTADA